jgi:N-acetyl sugar amidotransferase
MSDTSINFLKLDKRGICRYCKIHDEMEKEYSFSTNSYDKLLTIAKKIKDDGKNKKYDCIVGVSGGKDSSYLLYLIKKKLKLRPLAVHYDNGFDSDISVSNILNVCQKLDVELETKVANWEAFKNITRSFFLAGVSDPDTPTDIGIFKTMYEIAYKEDIKYVFNGHSFRTEGIEPLDWTYMDGLYLKDVHEKHGDGDISKFDNFTLKDLLKFQFYKRIKTILPLNYIEYNDKEVKSILQEELGWVNYGGHHHESLLTKFIVSYYLPKKFGIDRRRTSMSAMVRSNKITRNDAFEILSTPPKIENEDDLKNYILDKLDIKENEFSEILNKKNKNFRNYKTYYGYFNKFSFFAKLCYKFNFIPKILYLRYFG